jgi:PTH1 family peptidyl-tRNA hydrolase
VKAVIGLGNPGPEHALTPHNVGFHVIDLYREAHPEIGRARRRFSALLYRHDDLLLVKPMTSMNDSGDAVRRIVARHGMAPGDLLVVHDELDLPWGRLRIVPGGGAGTHKGVDSVHRALGTQRIARLKIGVEIDGRTLDGAGYVLQRIPEERWTRLVPVLQRAAEALETFRVGSLEEMMTRFNRPPDAVAAS